MSICGLYEIFNTVSRKKYIGSSIDVDRRSAAHKSHLRGNKHKNTYLQNSWNKHGEEAFEFKVLRKVPEHELLIEEQIELDSYPAEEVYNLSLVVDRPMAGRKHTEESKKKMSISRVGKKHSTEARKRMSEAQLGRKHTEATKIKISKSSRSADPEVRRKLSEAHKGKKVTQSTRDKQSLAKSKGTWTTPWGMYISLQKAIQGSPIKVSRSVLYRWCLSMNLSTVSCQKYLQVFTQEDVVGKTFKELGFGFVPESTSQQDEKVP